MATRSTTSEYLPSPPNYTRNQGKITGRIGIRVGTTTNAATKPNMSCAPTGTHRNRQKKLSPSW